MSPSGLVGLTSTDSEYSLLKPVLLRPRESVGAEVQSRSRSRQPHEDIYTYPLVLSQLSSSLASHILSRLSLIHTFSR